jgi:hypothetical protein
LNTGNVPSGDLAGESAKILEWLRSSTQSAGDFAITQAPLAAQEFIRWEIVGHGITAGLYLICGIAMLICGILGLRYLMSDKMNWEKGPNGGFAVSAVGCILGFAAMVGVLPSGISEAKQSIKAYVAPRVVIIEKISDLVR